MSEDHEASRLLFFVLCETKVRSDDKPQETSACARKQTAEEETGSTDKSQDKCKRQKLLGEFRLVQSSVQAIP
jgi:hypothetical protein